MSSLTDSLFGKKDTRDSIFSKPQNSDPIQVQPRKRQKQRTVTNDDDIYRADLDTDLPAQVQAQEAAQLIRTHGFCIVPKCYQLTSDERAAIEQTQIRIENALGDKKHEIFSYKEAASRCPGRIDIKLDTSFCIEKVENVANALLGGQAKLLYTGLILNYPGSDDQPFHQDGHPLFPETDIDLPPYAVNVFLPLHDQTPEMGPTEFEVDLAQPVVAPILKQGDVLFYDYRTIHRGTTNRSHVTRRILYLLYARPWFQDHVNFGDKSVFSH